MQWLINSFSQFAPQGLTRLARAENFERAELRGQGQRNAVAGNPPSKQFRGHWPSQMAATAPVSSMDLALLPSRISLHLFLYICIFAPILSSEHLLTLRILIEYAEKGRHLSDYSVTLFLALLFPRSLCLVIRYVPCDLSYLLWYLNGLIIHVWETKAVWYQFAPVCACATIRRNSTTERSTLAPYGFYYVVTK